MVFAACVRCAACDNRRPYFQRLFGVLVTASVDVLNACQTLIDPNTGKDFVSQKSIRNVKVDGDTVSLELVLGYPAQSQHDAFREQIIGAVRALPGVGKVNVQVHTDMELDYLVVDLPPGTGDIQLTLSQKVPVTGAVIVTTPQDIALLDARKGLKMFEKVGIPILGIVENMSIHICSNCGHQEHIFGSGGGEKMCADYGTELLGSLPLDIKIREQADSGSPTVVADPQGPISALYKAIARKVAIKVAEKAADMSAKFPKIVVQNT
ncbi:MAG: DUF59 domain-containing protein [Betaproteobacteria bacterium]|nr:DUF59 domain-containing protein [Betaproteobacteria bacterium]